VAVFICGWTHVDDFDPRYETRELGCFCCLKPRDLFTRAEVYNLNACTSSAAIRSIGRSSGNEESLIIESIVDSTAGSEPARRSGGVGDCLHDDGQVESILIKPDSQPMLTRFVRGPFTGWLYAESQSKNTFSRTCAQQPGMERCAPEAMSASA